MARSNTGQRFMSSIYLGSFGVFARPKVTGFALTAAGYVLGHAHGGRSFHASVSELVAFSAGPSCC